MKVKGVNVTGLNKRQVKAMRRHAKHHTRKHWRSMVTRMKRGRPFTQSNILAMRKVGR